MLFIIKFILNINRNVPRIMIIIFTIVSTIIPFLFKIKNTQFTAFQCLKPNIPAVVTDISVLVTTIGINVIVEVMFDRSLLIILIRVLLRIIWRLMLNSNLSRFYRTKGFLLGSICHIVLCFEAFDWVTRSQPTRKFRIGYFLFLIDNADIFPVSDCFIS